MFPYNSDTTIFLKNTKMPTFLVLKVVNYYLKANSYLWDFPITWDPNTFHASIKKKKKKTDFLVWYFVIFVHYLIFQGSCVMYTMARLVFHINPYKEIPVIAYLTSFFGIFTALFVAGFAFTILKFGEEVFQVMNTVLGIYIELADNVERNECKKILLYYMVLYGSDIF